MSYSQSGVRTKEFPVTNILLYYHHARRAVLGVTYSILSQALGCRIFRLTSSHSLAHPSVLAVLGIKELAQAQAPTSHVYCTPSQINECTYDPDLKTETVEAAASPASEPQPGARGSESHTHNM